MRILLVQTSFLGDVILSSPVVVALRSLYPEAEIYTLTTPQAKLLLQHDPFINGCLEFDKRGVDRGLFGMLRLAKKIRNLDFDRAYVLQRSYRTAFLMLLSRIPYQVGFRESRLSWLYNKRFSRAGLQHEVERNLAILEDEKPSFEGDLSSIRLRLILPDLTNYKPSFQDLLNGLGPHVVLFPGSAWKTKMWNWQGFKEVAQFLSTRGYDVLVLGTKSEWELCQKICQVTDNSIPPRNLAGSTSLLETALLVKHAKLVVCNDSMSLHMASAFGVPCVAAFCATSPAFGFGPWQNVAEVVERSELVCKPCSRHGSMKCPTGTESCMRDLPSSDVIAAIGRVVNG